MDNCVDISVIMSVYNTDEKWLREAIESILNQTYSDFEFIIIWDCSTDNSLQIIKEYAESDKRILIIENDKNIGLTKSLNKGLKIAKGKYVARMDADDVSTPTRFEKQLHYMETHTGIVALGGYTIVESGSGKKCGKGFYIDNKGGYKTQMLFYNAGIAHPTALIRKSFLDEKNISYNEDIKKSQDYQLWYDIVSNGGELCVLPEIVLQYRVHENQISHGRTDQNRYANLVKLTALHDLVGECDDIYKRIHCDIIDNSVFYSKKEYYDYFKMLKINNANKKRYNRHSFNGFLNYLWMKIGLQYFLRMHSLKYIFSWRTIGCFNAIPYFYQIYCKAPYIRKKALKGYKSK